MITLYLYLGAVGILFAVLYLAYRHGEKMEKLSGLEDKIKAVEDAKEVKDKISKLPIDTVHDRLSKWRR